MSDHLRRWPAPKTLVNPGDEIKGTLIAWDPLSEKYPIAHIKTADGYVRLLRITQVRLHELIADADPQIGDVIWIRYDGESEKAMRGLNKTKLFTVKVRPAGSQPPNGTGTSGDGSGQRSGAGT